jgi:hypothetical protein
MSANKLKYFSVTTTHFVKANNQSDASALVARKRGITGEVLSSSQWTERVSAAEAKGDLEQTA